MKTRADFPILLNARGLTGNGVEVGVFRGEFSRHILEYWLGNRLYMVDSWRYLPEYKDISGFVSPEENISNVSLSLFKIYKYGERAVVIRDMSTLAADLFQDCSLDFVYIDAGHDYASVWNDLNAWVPKVKIGGIISGHDYLSSPMSENGCADFEVKDAVDEFFDGGQKVNVTTNDKFPTWWTEI